MLRSHHGSLMLGHPAIRKRAINLTSLDGIADLAAGATRTVFMASSQSQPKSQALLLSHSTNLSRTWNPHHGIKFGATAALSLPASRSMHTFIVPAYDDPSSDHSSAENASLESSPSTTTSNPIDFPTEGLSSSDGSESPSDAVSEALPPAIIAEEHSHTPLKFAMSPELFEETKNAPLSKRYWSYALYRGPDGPDHKVKVHYCRSKHTSETVAQYFLNSDVIGFDIEWKIDSYKYGGAKQNVSLIQIANDEKVALFHVALFAKDGIDDLVPPTLKKIMEDPKIIKVGVAIKGDCTRLRKHLNIDSRGVFELSNLYRLIKYSASGEYEKINKRLVNLASQVEEHLELPLFKGDEVRGSDWTQALGLEQLSYAASDSYAGLRLFDVMEAKRKELRPTPPRPYFSEQGLPIRLADGIALQSADDEAEDIEPASAATEGTLAVDGTSIEFEVDSAGLPASAKPASKTRRKKDVKKAPEIIEAEKWVLEWRSLKPQFTSKATPASLRAYALWQHQGFTVEEMSALLKIQKTTVANYVAEAIRSEKLLFERERLAEVLSYIPGVAARRYQKLMVSL